MGETLRDMPGDIPPVGDNRAREKYAGHACSSRAAVLLDAGFDTRHLHHP